jgi:hypothetical protein
MACSLVLQWVMVASEQTWVSELEMVMDFDFPLARKLAFEWEPSSVFRLVAKWETYWVVT